ncbi:hypothetical protein ACHAPT_003952 [Fusarium lateritium]
MADTPNDNGTLAETPNASFVRDREGHFGSSSDTDVEVDNADEERGKDHIQKRLTLTFQDVTVRVTAPDEALGETLWSRVDPRQLGGLFKGNNRPMRTILNDVSGQVNPGEMLLVLGRPGSGCTSLLRVLSNHREAFQEVTGQTNYGNMDHIQARKFRQQIIFNTEDDIHFPTLTVNQTMKFALRNKVPRERPDHVEKKHHFVQDMRNHILDSLGIGHTQKTLVGNEFIRGVSGGERKRVSLAEVMASQSPLQFWDQPTRGLDSKTALEFVETLRRDADRNGKSVVLTTYQAGNGIFDAFDKVLVLAEGRVIYYGLRAAAKSYFEDMGFVCPRGANVADFLTSVTVKTEREVASGFEGRIPTTAEEFENAYKRSEVCQLMGRLLQRPENMDDQVEDLKMAVEREKRQRSWRVGKRGVYTAGLREQVINCTQRQWQIMMGDRLSLSIKVISAIIQALVCGSLFYNLPLTSESIFLRPGVLFFPVLYFLLESMSETTASFMGRPILMRHKRFGFYRPTAFCIANAITDIPVVMVQVTCFSLILYFMSYLIPFSKMHPWFRWIFYLNPGAYAFESLMTNEFQGLSLECVAPQYIPFGGDYDTQSQQYRGCTVLGSDNSGMIDGVTYVQQQYDYAVGHIWRGFGIIIGFWIFLIGLTALGFELRNSHGGSSVLLYKRGSRTKKVSDPEKEAGRNSESLQMTTQATRQSTFSWHNLDYYVQYQGAQKQLLNQVFGYVQPGNLVALMGCSGAGKTTLLDVLAQRKDAGEIRGSILIDGKPQGISFQRMTGYCEQMDVHEATATVKEALVFSAVLRQPRDVPYKEKLAYVDHIIELLELEDICDALIGTPGAGLSIEQRKRVTLGVELVAKPTLLFLDEPTSGLDGQSAYNIVRFMRRLVDGGQAVLCTIHQPSAVLFDAFDSLLLLAKGGRMAYFGETGQYSKTLLDYFAKNGAPCPEGANPAEHIVEVIQGNSEVDVDWVDVWIQSPERARALEKLEKLNQEAIANTRDQVEDTASFATSKWFQWKTVLHRQMIQLWRSPDYVWNKINLHIFAALFSGFTFWMIGDGTFDLQLRLFAIFNFIFVAPGCINQMQPYFLHNRDLFETREKKAIYEFLYTSVGQAIAAYAPNEYFAAIMNPVLIGAGMVSFCGVVVPYDAMQPFWKYWLYYLDPFHYLFGGLMGPIIWDVKVECRPEEFTSFNVPDGQTCGEYVADFLSVNAGYVADVNATGSCDYCAFSTGAEYAKTFNLREEYYGWRDTGITALFCISSYALVFLMMKLRSKKTKSARSD